MFSDEDEAELDLTITKNFFNDKLCRSSRRYLDVANDNENADEKDDFDKIQEISKGASPEQMNDNQVDHRIEIE